MEWDEIGVGMWFGLVAGSVGMGFWGVGTLGWVKLAEGGVWLQQ